MHKESVINKQAWEYKSYEFFVKSNGLPSECAKDIMKSPIRKLKKHGKYFKNVKGLKIANPCGSNGRRAVALSLLGADVTIFDICEGNKRYALELADCANVKLNYVIGDLYDLDIKTYRNYFDMLYLEGGILHYFYDIDKLMNLLFTILKPGGKIVLNDFHPFRKVMIINYFKSTIGDYFDDGIHQGDVAYKDFLEEEDKENCPCCAYRLYTISEIINSMIRNGFIIKEFNEDPSWTDEKLPGEFTIYAMK